MPDGVPMIPIHGTRDDNVDIWHAVDLSARLLACGKEAPFYAIANGEHGLTGTEAEDERTRAAATIKHAGRMLQAVRRPDAARRPATRTIIPVTGGHHEVRFRERGATLRHVSQGRDGDAEA